MLKQLVSKKMKYQCCKTDAWLVVLEGQHCRNYRNGFNAHEAHRASEMSRIRVLRQWPPGWCIPHYSVALGIAAMWQKYSLLEDSEGNSPRITKHQMKTKCSHHDSRRRIVAWGPVKPFGRNLELISVTASSSSAATDEFRAKQMCQQA